MRKRMLDAAELRVQSFVAAAVPASRGGTVHAVDATPACSLPLCGTVVRAESCYSGCTDPEFC